MKFSRKPRPAAFTLIELLIVVAIIAILAAIAVPNFLEAQTRSKVSRVKSDFRTLSIALESYAIDCNQYPPIGNNVDYTSALWRLTTPVAYLSQMNEEDPFLAGIKQFGQGNADSGTISSTSTSTDYQYANYAQWGNFNFKSWFVASVGPARVRYGLFNLVTMTAKGNPKGVLGLTNSQYDPTNGTMSWGNIMRIGGDTPSKLAAIVTSGH